MIIEIDNREPSKVKEYFETLCKSNSEYQLQLLNLAQGDYILRDANNTIQMIIERKTITDLLASVKDNRYKEQAERFAQLEISHSKVYYIIEGNLNHFSKDSIDYKTIYSCIFSLNYKYEYSVILTATLDKTIEFIEQYLIRLQKNKDESTSVVSLVKKQTVTPENLHSYMLSIIPNISFKTACELLGHFNNNLYTFWTKIKENIDILNTIKINNRKISKKVIENIVIYLN